MTPHRTPIRVYYEDTDLAGVVYYANYLKFLERGRTEALRAAGVDQSALQAQGLVFAVAHVEIDYRRSARFDDLLTVETELTRIGGASVDLVQRVLRGGELIAPAHVRVVCMTLAGRPFRMPEDLRRALGAVAQN